MQGNTFAKLLVTRIRSFDLKCDLRNETKIFHIANLFKKKKGLDAIIWRLYKIMREDRYQNSKIKTIFHKYLAADRVSPALKRTRPSKAEKWALISTNVKLNSKKKNTQTYAIIM